MRKSLMKNLFLLSLPLLTLVLAGCGGSSDSDQSTSDVLTDPVSENVHSRQVIDLSGQYPVTGKASKSQKAPLVVRQASSNQQVDANISWPLESNSSNKNLRFRLTVSSDSEVSDIYLKWAESDEVYAICQSDCGSDFEASVIGLNPYLAGYSAGELELQVVVNLNTLEPTIAQRAFINWQPFSIETLAVERTEQALNIDWQGDTNFDRYNVYVAPIANFAPNEIPTIEGAKQFLALTESTLTVGDINTDTTYYVLVTGVDDSGESGFSNIVRVNSTSTVNIQPPQAISDEFTVPEDEALVGNVLENDVASSAISVNLDAVTLPLNGDLLIEADGEFEYQPAADFSGNDEFSYEVVDESGNRATATVSIEVAAVNDAPIAIDDEYELSESRTLDVVTPGVLNNDVDIDTDTESLEVTLVDEPEFGSVTLNEDGGFSYQANDNFDAEDSFSYSVFDGESTSSEATVVIKGPELNVAPTVVNDEYTLLEDTILAIEDVANGFLANDTDPEGDVLTLNSSLVSEPAHGELTVFDDGTFRYVPVANYFGSDSFTYELSDSAGNSAQGTVVLNIDAVVDNPVANDDVYEALTGMTLSIVATEGLAANDINIDDLELEYQLASENDALVGSITIKSDGGLEYIPLDGFLGSDNFTYQILVDGIVVSTASVTIEVKPSLGLESLSLGTTEDINLSSNIFDSFANLSEGHSLTVVVSETSAATLGTFVINSTGDYSFEPSPNVSGSEVIEITIINAEQVTQKVNLTLTVTAVNDAPEVTLGALTIDEDGVLAGDLTAYVSDIESDTITFITTPKTDVTSGTLVINEAGTFTYTPSLNFFGVDSFEYEVQDSNGAKTTGTLNLTVNTINDLPTALDTVLNIAEDNVLAGDLTTLVSDVEGDTLTIDTAPVSPTSNGALSIASDGSFTYTPSLNFFGSDSFDYKVTDDKGGESTGTVTLTVTTVNDAPILSDTSLGSIAENVLSGFSIGTINATDVEGDDITYSLVGGDASLFNIDSTTGELTVNGDNLFDFELSQSHVVTVRAQDNGIPTAEFTDAVISIGINNVVEGQVPVEDSSFGRGLTGFQDLNTTDVKGEFNATTEYSGKLYFAGYSNNVDEDIYVTSVDIDGSTITSFGNNGVFELNLGGDERVIDISEGGGELYMLVEKQVDEFQELCVVKIDPSGNLDSAGGDNNSGIRCTTEDSELYAGSIIYDSNKVYVVGHRDNGAELDSLFIKLDENSLDFEQSSPIYNDVSTSGLDDKAHAIKNFDSSELMIVGATKNSNGDWDAYVRYVNNIGVNDSGFNGGADLILTSIDNGGDDELLTLGGDSGGGFVAYLGGYTEQSLGSKDALLVAIDKNGLLNAAFATDGVAIYDLDGDGGAGTGSSVIHAINREFTTDNLMVIGNKSTGGDQQGFAMKVATADSALDISYGTFGEFVLTDSESISVNDVVVDENFRAWFAGSFGTSSSQPYIRALNQNASDYGCFPDDSVSCAESGKLVVDLSGNTAEDNAPALIKLNNGPHANKLLSVINVGTGLNAIVVLQRYTEIGTLDVTLGTNGMKQVYLGSNVLINGLVEQSDGNIVLFGRANTVAGETHGILARINQDGEIDETYGTNGIFYTDSIALTSDTQVKAVAIDSSNDKVVAVGETTYSASTRPFVMRATPTGELDSNIDSFDGITSAFDTSGYIIDSSDKTFEAVGIDGNNKVIVAGSEDTGVTNFWLYRFNPDGSLDNSFDGNGSLRITRASFDDQVNKLLINSANELYILGYSNNITDDSYMVKVKNDGTLDTSFGSSGLLSFNNTISGGVDSRIIDAAIDSQDRIVAIGIGENGSTFKGAINRITASGSLDTLFGVNSDGHYIDEQCAQEQSFTSMILNTDNQIIVTNQCQVGTNFDTSITLFNFYEEGVVP